MKRRTHDLLTAFILIYGMLFIVGLIMLCLNGCTNAPATPGALPAIGSGLDKAQAHVESAEQLVKQATPDANSNGKSLLTAASGEHAAAITSIKEGNAALVTATAQSQTKDNQIASLTGKYDSIEKSWGYRLQVWVERIFWIIVGLVALHVILGTAALFVSGPVGAGLAVAGAAVNPAAWFQTLRDNLFFRKATPAGEAAPTITATATIPATPKPTT